MDDKQILRWMDGRLKDFEAREFYLLRNSEFNFLAVELASIVSKRDILWELRQYLSSQTHELEVVQDA